MGICHSNSSDKRPYDSKTTDSSFLSYPADNSCSNQDIVLNSQPNTISPIYLTIEPQYPVTVNMSQVTEKSLAANAKTSSFSKISSKLPKFNFVRKPTQLPKPGESRLVVLTNQKEQLSSCSSLSSGDAGSSINSCKSNDSISANKPTRLGSQPLTYGKNFKNSSPTIANSDHKASKVNGTSISTHSLCPKITKPKSTSSLVRPKSLVSKCQSNNKISPQPSSKIAVVNYSSDQECLASAVTTRIPLKFTTSVTNAPKQQTAQLVLTNSINGPKPTHLIETKKDDLLKKLSNPVSTNSFGIKASNAFNPYKRSQPSVTRNTNGSSLPTPKLFVTRSSVVLPHCNNGSMTNGKLSIKPSTHLSYTKLPIGSQITNLPSFGQPSITSRSVTASTVTVDQKLESCLKDKDLDQAEDKLTMKNGLTTSNDQTDFATKTTNDSSYKILHRPKKSPLGSAGNTISSESNSTYTSSSDSPDKCSNDPSRLDFLIDDEICDQPELILNEKNELIERPGSDHTISSGSSLQSSPAKSTISCSINELATLKMKQAILDSSNCSTLEGNRSIRAANGIRHSNSFSGVRNSANTFRKPRPLSMVESSDGNIEMDGSSKRNIMQDIHSIKTLLLRLHRELQNAETQNPFSETLYAKVIKRKDCNGAEENTELQNESPDLDDLYHENFDLKRQILLQQQQLEEKDRTIRLLQQQMTKYLNIKESLVAEKQYCNSTTQTEKCCLNGFAPKSTNSNNGMVVSDDICVHCDGIPAIDAVCIGESEC